MRSLKTWFNPNTKAFWEKNYQNMIGQGKLRCDGDHLLKFRNLFENADSILDFGAGLGGDVQYIARLVEKTHFMLVDHSETCQDYAKNQLLGFSDKRGNSYSYHLNLNDIEDESVEMVISIQVLEHITGYRAIMDQLWKKLKPGGILFISVPVKGRRDSNRQHVNKFTVTSMFKILSNYNEIIHIAVRDYTNRSGRLSTAYFYVQKAGRK